MQRETTKISFVEGAALAVDTIPRPEILGHGLLAGVQDISSPMLIIVVPTSTLVLISIRNTSHGRSREVHKTAADLLK